MTFLKILTIALLSFGLQAMTCKKVTKALGDLYPHHTKDMIATRIENAKDEHKFMRGFIPYWYKKVFEAREAIPVHAKLKNTIGQIAGDAHVENFGYMINNEGKPILTMNDYDDVAKAPLYLDVLRLSQSAKYMDDVKQSKMLAAYKKGLQNAKYEYSNYMKKLSKKSAKGGTDWGGSNYGAEYKATKNGYQFTSKGEPTFVTTEIEQAAIKKALSDKFGSKVKFHDSYRTMKESGGSAYGSRFHVLVDLDGKIQFIELKEIFDSGVISKFAVEESNEQRIRSAQSIFLGTSFSQKLDVVTVENKLYQLRFKSKGNIAIDFDVLEEKNYQEVIEDDFYILGQLHRKSLDNSPLKINPYLDALNSVSKEEWKQSVKVMTKKIDNAFDKAKE